MTGPSAERELGITKRQCYTEVRPVEDPMRINPKKGSDNPQSGFRVETMIKILISNFSRTQIQAVSRKKVLSLPFREIERGTSDGILEAKGDENENELCRALEVLQKNYTNKKILRTQIKKRVENSQSLVKNAQGPMSLIGNKLPGSLRQHIRFSTKQ